MQNTHYYYTQYEEQDLGYFDALIASGLTEEVVETIHKGSQFPFGKIRVYHEMPLESFKRAKEKDFLLVKMKNNLCVHRKLHEWTFQKMVENGEVFKKRKIISGKLSRE